MDGMLAGIEHFLGQYPRLSGSFSDILTVVGLLAALIGFLVALLRYIETQRWSRINNAAALVNRINENPRLRLAVIFLDWEDRDVLIGPAHGLSIDVPGGKFHHTRKQMVDAFDRANFDFDNQFERYEMKIENRTPANMIYIEVFDEFFAYLEQVWAYKTAGLLTKDDIPSIIYYLQTLDYMLFMRAYIEAHEIDGVVKFMEFARADDKQKFMGRVPYWSKTPVQ